MPKIDPTIGRKMWFRRDRSPEEAALDGPFYDAQPEDATVVCVHADGTVNLLVLDRKASARAELHVRIRQPGEPEPVRPYVEWMPSQVGTVRQDTPGGLMDRVAAIERRLNEGDVYGGSR